MRIRDYNLDDDDALDELAPFEKTVQTKLRREDVDHDNAIRRKPRRRAQRPEKNENVAH